MNTILQSLIACLCIVLAPALSLVLSPFAQADIIAGKPTVFITGANRGIGFEFVKQYSARGWNVIATARKPEQAEQLKALAAKRRNITIEQLDVTDHQRMEELGKQYQQQPIDVLLNNAAITPRYKSAYKKLNGVDFDMARKSLEVNAIGPLKMASVFMPHVEASDQKKIIVISSKAGSFAEGPNMPIMYSYRASKAALNMYMHTLAFQTKKKGVTVALLSPGLVNTSAKNTTGMRMPNAIEPPESVGNMIAIINSLKPEDNGKFLNHKDKSIVAW